MLNKMLFISIILIIFSSITFGFTKDHEFLLLKVKEMVPQLKRMDKILYKEVIQLKTILDNHSIKNFSVSTETRAYLNKHQLYTPYYLHQPIALPDMFKLLIKAIQDDNKEEIKIWIAAISHNINDAISWQKEPHVRYYKDFIISFENNFHINKTNTIADQKVFNFSLEKFSKKNVIHSKLNYFINEYKPNIISDNIENASKKILNIPYILRNIRNKKIPQILQKINDTIFNIQNKGKSNETAILELLQLGLSKTADVIFSAWSFAKKNTLIDLNDQEPIFKKLKELNLNLINNQKHIFLNPIYPEGTKTYVILTEGEKFRETVFGETSKLIVSCLINYFKDKKIPYFIMDINDLNQDEKLNLKKHKALIIPALEYNIAININSTTLRNKISFFAKEGAPIIWLGGHKRPYMLEKINSLLQYHKEEIELTSSTLTKYVQFENPQRAIYSKLPSQYKIPKIFPTNFNLSNRIMAKNLDFLKKKKAKVLIKIEKLTTPTYSQIIAVYYDNQLYAPLYNLFPNIHNDYLSSFYPFKWDKTNIIDFDIYLKLFEKNRN